MHDAGPCCVPVPVVAERAACSRPGHPLPGWGSVMAASLRGSPPQLWEQHQGRPRSLGGGSADTERPMSLNGWAPGWVSPTRLQAPLWRS